ncbi:MAG: serine/threonine protein kinase [Synechococcaceae cyanobacterium RL_1_2]|nr:serine/threonine protein kinase [Synechococcaceae cyanobacterium RL_1_2]
MAAQNCYCINPHCQRPDYPQNNDPKTQFCLDCGSPLLLNNRYRVSRLLNSDSGFGLVYEAFEGFSSKILKVLKPEWNDQPKAISLFHQEYQVLAQLSNQGLTGIPAGESFFEYLSRDNLKLYCLVMAKVEGVDLAQWVNIHGTVNQTQAVKWLTAIVEILEKVHSLNYFHRDIKPANIMMRNNGELVLIDFGTAREENQTYLHKVQGNQVTRIVSAGYTPNEQQYGQATPQSDFFALGRTFVHLLTGHHPLELPYDSVNDRLGWREQTEGIAPALLDLIDHLMAPSPRDRPRNASAIKQQLIQITQGKNTLSNLNHGANHQQTINHTINLSKTEQPSEIQLPHQHQTQTPVLMVVSALLLMFSSGIVFFLATHQAPRTENNSITTDNSNTPQIPEATVSAIAPPSPEQSIKTYYSLINGQNYGDAWQNLSLSLRNDREFHPKGYASYTEWWTQIQTVEVLGTSLNYEQGNESQIDCEVRYVVKGSGRIIQQTLRFDFILDPEPNVWLITKVSRL